MRRLTLITFRLQLLCLLYQHLANYNLRQERKKWPILNKKRSNFRLVRKKAPSSYSFFWVSTKPITRTYCLSLQHDVPASANSSSGWNFYVCLLLVCCLLAEWCQEWVILQGSDLQSQSEPAQQPDRRAISFLFMTEISLIRPCSLPTWSLTFILAVIKQAGDSRQLLFGGKKKEKKRTWRINKDEKWESSRC